MADGVDLIVDKHLELALANIVPTIATSQEMVMEALVFTGDKSYIPVSMQEQADKAVADNEKTKAKRSRKVQQIV